jgi:hypothetical protein
MIPILCTARLKCFRLHGVSARETIFTLPSSNGVFRLLGEAHIPHRRRTAKATQCEVTGSLGAKFPGPADDCGNHTAAVPLAKRVFFNTAEPIGCRVSVKS